MVWMRKFHSFVHFVMAIFHVFGLFRAFCTALTVSLTCSGLVKGIAWDGMILRYTYLYFINSNSQHWSVDEDPRSGIPDIQVRVVAALRAMRQPPVIPMHASCCRPARLPNRPLMHP
jgi:hypothetical protein